MKGNVQIPLMKTSFSPYYKETSNTGRKTKSSEIRRKFNPVGKNERFLSDGENMNSDSRGKTRKNGVTSDKISVTSDETSQTSDKIGIASDKTSATNFEKNKICADDENNGTTSDCPARTLNKTSSIRNATSDQHGVTFDDSVVTSYRTFLYTCEHAITGNALTSDKTYVTSYSSGGSFSTSDRLPRRALSSATRSLNYSSGTSGRKLFSSTTSYRRSLSSDRRALGSLRKRATSSVSPRPMDATSGCFWRKK